MKMVLSLIDSDAAVGISLMLPFIYGGAAAAGTALVLALACRFLLPLDAARRHALAIGVAGGFFVGYVLLDDWAPLLPKKYWQWLPYLALIAAAIGPATQRLHVVEQWILQLCLYAIAALALTPTWESLAPPRTTWIPLLTAGMLVLGGLLMPLANRVPSFFLAAIMALSGIVGVAMIAGESSFQDAEVTNLAAATFCASALVCLFDRGLNVGAVVPAFVVLVGGSVFTAHVYPDPPMRPLLLFPCAPLALWVGQIKPIARMRAWKKIAIQIIAVAAVLATGVALLMIL